MEQKDYNLEIILMLLVGNMHIRGLAKQLGTNHMNIVRKVRELASKNVLDFKKEGKNKVYFIKKTGEARAYVIMAENYKHLSALKRYLSLRNIFDKIQKNKSISLAVLFGSYAKGLAKPDSDIDIYIDTSSKKLKKDIEIIDSRISVKIGKYNKDSLLIKEIEKNHIIIKGFENYYEREKFFD